MSLKKLYFDESGFTGYNYLDRDQPVFAVASTDIDPKISEEILKSSFPDYKAHEFKFSNIFNSSNEARLNEFGRLMKPYAEQCYVFVVDKRFATLLKIVDFLLEPNITNSGYDFYKNGFCRRYANYIYIGLTLVAKTKVFDELIYAYQLFSRNPSESSLREFTLTLRLLEAKVDPEVRGQLTQMVDGANSLLNHCNVKTFKTTNDLQLTTMLEIVCYWRRNHKEDFAIIHDNSSNFSRQSEMWDAISNPSVPVQHFPYGDGSVVEYPLRVVQTTGVKSQDNYSVQLCDILAGFSSQHFKHKLSGKENKPVYNQAILSGLGNINFNSLQANGEFPDGPPELLTGPDMVDVLANIYKQGKRP